MKLFSEMDETVVNLVEKMLMLEENRQPITNDVNVKSNANDGDEEEEDDVDDIANSIYIPQPVLKFNEKDANWHEVTVFLQNASSNDYKIEEVDMNETRQRIDTHMLNMKDLNPFEPELQKDVLNDVGFVDLLNGANNFNCTLLNIVKPLKPKSSFINGKKRYEIRKLIGEGAYGKVFAVECADTKRAYAFKQQRPPNLWEYYVCLQIQKRIEDQSIVSLSSFPLLKSRILLSFNCIFACLFSA